MSKAEEYRQYLKSGTWQEKRDLALDRTSGFCQFCGAPAEHVHHTKYPKQLGTEHPNNLIPVCKRCHDISHGIQDMQVISQAELHSELTPQGGKLKYLVSGARVYASAASWARALQLPQSLWNWFEQGLPRTAMIRKDFPGGSLSALYQNIQVYRWHAVAELLRAFDRNWYQHQYRSRSKFEQIEIEKFHKNYEHLVYWGYALQERALTNIMIGENPQTEHISQTELVDAISQIVQPQLNTHQEQLTTHDLVISELQNSVPTLRDEEEFITIRQAFSEQGLDPALMPLYPSSKENFSGITGQLLKKEHVAQGPTITTRIDGQSLAVSMNTYPRKAIYSMINKIIAQKQLGLPFSD